MFDQINEADIPLVRQRRCRETTFDIKGDVTINIKYYEQHYDHKSRNIHKMDKSMAGGGVLAEGLASVDLRRDRNSKRSYKYYMD